MSQKLTSTKPLTKVTVAAIGAIALLASWFSFFSSAANAEIIGYTGSTTSGQLVINTGPNQTVLDNPQVQIESLIDNTTGAVTADLTFTPIFTPTFVGPFDLVLYASASITEVGSSTGTVDVATNDFTLNTSAKLAITVYNRLGGTPDPATDQKLTGPGCVVDVGFEFTGNSQDAATVTLADSAFAIPQFPAGDANCWLATDELNNRLAGPNNSVTLTFSGNVATTTSTSTSTTSSTTTSTSTTLPATTTTIDPCQNAGATPDAVIITTTTVDPCLPTTTSTTSTSTSTSTTTSTSQPTTSTTVDPCLPTTTTTSTTEQVPAVADGAPMVDGPTPDAVIITTTTADPCLPTTTSTTSTSTSTTTTVDPCLPTTTTSTTEQVPAVAGPAAAVDPCAPTTTVAPTTASAVGAPPSPAPVPTCRVNSPSAWPCSPWVAPCS